MIEIRPAQLGDVEQIRDVFKSAYGENYAYPEYFDIEALTRLVFADGSILLVAVDTDQQRVVGTASVVFSIGAYNDLVGEFGRLVVHPDARSRGIGGLLMESRIRRVQSRLHVGIVENRVAHTHSQQISNRFEFVPVGFIPMKLLLERREPVSVYVRHFGEALHLRRNNPRVIPEASQLASLALANCRLPQDPIIDDTSPPYPHHGEFQLEAMETEGYAALLRIERGRLRKRDVFGPVRLHYGLFQLRARHSNYLLAKRGEQIVGGVGYMLDPAEKAARIFELISVSDEPIRFLLQAMLRTCQEDLHVEYIDVDVSAYAPRMQRTLLELGFLPVSYVPAKAFHEVERLDAIKMVRLLTPYDLGEYHTCPQLQPIAELVADSFASKEAAPRIAAAAAEVPLFAGLSAEQRQCLVATGTATSFQPGELLYRAGDPSRAAHLVLCGKVALRDPQERPVAEITTGQCLGEGALLAGDTRHHLTAAAIDKVETALFDAEELALLLRRRPDIGVVVYRNLAQDISAKLTSSNLLREES